MNNSLPQLLDTATQTWLPHWFALFSDNDNDGFHERLDAHGQPLDLPKRLLSQCRQIITYASAPNMTPYKEKLDESFQFIIDKYHTPKTGGCIFSIENNGTPHDSKYDLYTHAFVILTAATYYQATQDKAELEFAKTTLNFIKNNFKLDIGYAEALDENSAPLQAIRRQNPHMHLMEACLSMYEVSSDKDYLNMADEMLALFFDKFFDEETGTLGEFFDENLSPHPTEGHKVEAGHHAEWVWLLKRYSRISGSTDPRIDAAMNRLFTWVKTQGIDPEFGGIYNVQDRQGNIIDANKRIWCQFETLRACAIMTHIPAHANDAQRIFSNLIKIIKTHYIDLKTGTWNEILNRNLSYQTNYLPATTPYHIYPVLWEIMERLK